MCRRWFDEIEPLEPTGGVLHLVVPEVVQLRYLQRCCVEPFTEAARAATGHLLVVRFIDEDERTRLEAQSAAKRNGRGERRASAADPPSIVDTHPRASRLSVGDDLLLSPDYTFENFVTGPGNQLGHAAAVAVARKPAQAYNPLFIYGGVGLGKTHLVQAICQEAMRLHPALRVHYVSCNGFMTQFIDAVKDGHMADFRHRFRNVDLLVIDDIHDLSKRGQAQEEFFHTFNSLYQAGRQIVLSSDASPHEIPDLEERLTSRFNCGLVARIEKPCFETRIAILKSKASLRNIELNDELSAYVASRIDSNIRELEGAITKIQGLSLLSRQPISLELARQAVGEQGHEPAASQSLTVQTIIDTLVSYYGVKLTDLLSRRRHKSVALPRQVGMYLARRHTRYSLEEIGGYFGGRDHTTVMHAIRTITTRRESDPDIAHDLDRLEHMTGAIEPSHG